MRFGLSVAAQPLLVLFVTALPVLPSSALAACAITGTIDLSIECGTSSGLNFGPQATATESGSTLTVDGVTVDDPDDISNSFSRIVLKAGSETGGAIDVGLALTGDTYVESHNSAAVYVLTKEGDITVDIGADVELLAQQSGIFAKADNSGSLAGGNVTVTNYGTIDAGWLTGQSLGSEGIRVRALQGEGTIYNYGSVTSRLGRGLRIDGGTVAGSSDALIVNEGSVDAWLDGMHIYAQAGSATIENGADATVISRANRGAVASSDDSDAGLRNDGTITSLTAAGALVWGAEDATLTNNGTITAAAADGDADDDFLNFGVQVWSTATGNASLVNGATGSIVAHDGLGAWLLSTDGDVTIANAGTLLGKSTAIYVGGDNIAEQYNESPDVPDHAGAVGGDLTVTNSGTITADATTDFTDGLALITLGGDDVDTVQVTNLAGGFIGAGFAEGADFSLGALTELSQADLTALEAAASNAAISMGIAAEASSISNAGTLVGRVAVASPYDTFGSGPVSYSSSALDNTGLWVTSGTSGYTTSLHGTITNSGDIFTLGTTILAGTLDNSGSIWVNGLSEDSADLTIAGHYTASGDAALIFDMGNDDGQLVRFTDSVSGQTSVVLDNLDLWDWQNDEPQTLIDIAYATPELGADSFVLATPIKGVVQYNLDYDDYGLDWTLSTEVSTQSTGEIAEAGAAVTTGFTQLSTGILNRTDDLRDSASGEIVAPIGYVEAKTPMDDALAALTPDPAVTRVWLKSGGAVGNGNGYDVQQGALELGADVTTLLGDEQFSAGAFLALSSSSLAFDAGSTASIVGKSAGLYATLVAPTGLFTSGVVAVGASDSDLAISGSDASVGGQTYGGRIDAGYRADLDGLVVEPSFALLASHGAVNDFGMSGVTVATADTTSVAAESRLRIMRRFVGETLDITPFLVLTLGREALSGGEVLVEGVTTEAATGGLYGGTSLGLGFDSPDGVLSGFVRGDLSATADSYLASLRLGGSRRF